ncbi:Flp pilus assembly protein CpaB [Klebsiella sp. 2680]|uniref:Flp pilus assembly protein CpaB n=1 Tax=Klebsiella sp. 2680 TaxID=2018037 RepID=UPI002803D7BA|nr:Flp pilus assembly protein CpaB [Klebsiella sp. 2680]
MRIKRNSTLLLSGACIFAAIVALLVRSQLSEIKPVPQQVQIPEPKNVVLVANRDLNPGDFIDTSALRWQETDLPVSRTFNFIRGKDSEVLLFGATLREKIAAGTPLNSNILVRPNEPGFIAAVLHKGMRAISIPTNAVASNSGLVAAGDKVDIILSLRKDDLIDFASSDNNASGIPQLASQTIVRDLRVLALNNQTDTDVRPRQDVENAQPAASRNTSKTSRSRSVSYQTVTVEVTPEQAEILAVAKEVGMLHLALRSTEDDAIPTQAAPPRVTTLSDSTQIYNGNGNGHQVKLFRGDKKETRTFPSR